MIHNTLQLLIIFFKPPKNLLGCGVAVIDNDVIVGALLVRIDDFGKLQKVLNIRSAFFVCYVN